MEVGRRRVEFHGPLVQRNRLLVKTGTRVNDADRVGRECILDVLARSVVGELQRVHLPPDGHQVFRMARDVQRSPGCERLRFLEQLAGLGVIVMLEGDAGEQVIRDGIVHIAANSLDRAGMRRFVTPGRNVGQALSQCLIHRRYCGCSARAPQQLTGFSGN